MPTERPHPRFPRTAMLAVAAGLLAVGVSVWGAMQQSADDDGEASAPSSAPTSPVGTAPDPSDGPSDGPSGEPAPDPQTRLREALAVWQDADTGTFTQTSTIPGIGRLALTGAYQLSTRSSDVMQVFTAEDAEPVEIRFLGAQGSAYLTSPDWGPELLPCWMRFDARVLAESTGTVLANGADSLPANVVALSHARGTRADPTDPEVVLGTVRLADAVPLFGSGLVRALDGATPGAPVAAKFRLVDGEIASWRISGRKMAAALASDPALTGPSGVLLAAVASYDVEIAYDGLGTAEVDVSAPAPELQMSRAEAEAGRGCRASR